MLNRNGVRVKAYATITYYAHALWFEICLINTNKLKHAEGHCALTSFVSSKYESKNTCALNGYHSKER